MWADIRAAFSFLTILPLGYVEGRKPGGSFAWYPLIGLFIGATLALMAAFSPFNVNVTGFLMVLAWAIMTGGLHLDGFGDSCDGLLATVTPERRLEIMKDPRTGTWAVVGLILLLTGKWAAVTTISPLLLIAPPVMGRWSMVIAAYAFPYARTSGLGSFFRDGLGRAQVIIATLLTLVITGILAAATTPFILLYVPLALLITVAVATWSARRLGGGITGDVYGAICEIVELICLLGFSLWANS